MDRFGNEKDLIINPQSLPIRRGKRPVTIRGPLHVQCGGHGDDALLGQLVGKVIAWPDVDAGPLPIGSAGLVSLRIGEDVATEDPSVFITGREFARVLFGSPTIYLTLPLSCAHWAIVRGWAEPHFSVRFRLMPPGTMVVYTPRDEHELVVCQSLFRVSYNFVRATTSGAPGELHELWPEVQRRHDIREPVAVAE